MNKRTKSLINLALIIGIAVFLNILGGAVHTYFDLTEEGRYTLTKPTVELIESSKDVVYFQVLLEGDFPAGFKRLQRSTREMIEDFRSHSGYIEYSFEDPNEGTVEEVNANRQRLSEMKITPVNLRVNTTEGMEQKLIYPYAIITYAGRSKTVNLLEPESDINPEITLNNSIGLLEYKFANAIQQLRRTKKPILAYLKGHGELSELQTKDLTNGLRGNFEVGYFSLDSTFNIPSQIDMLLVAKPTQPFSEQDKFKIDQYVMNGGKIVWMIDRMAMNLDSLRGVPYFVPQDYPLEIEDLLYKYGFRVEPNLLADRQCSKIPQVVGRQGGKPQFDMFDWFYHPIVTPPAENPHPVVKSLGGVNLLFPSSVDTIKTKTETKKTVLLTSSRFSKLQYSPVRVSFDILRYQPESSWFNKSEIPVAIMSEGIFSSAYANRVSSEMEASLQDAGKPFKAESVPTNMVVISDGDIGKNLLTADGSYKPLGFNAFTERTYANKNFLVNTIEYMFDDGGVIAARGKDVKLRLLDKPKIEESRGFYQFINIALPLIFLGIFAFIFNWLRRRKYASNV